MTDNPAGSGDDPNDSVSMQGEDVSTILPIFLARSFLIKFILTLSIVLVIVGGVGLFTLNEVSGELTTDTRTEYTGVANQSATQIENWRTARADTVRRLSQFQVMQNGNISGIKDLINDEANTLPNDIYKIHYLNLDDTNIVASNDSTRANTTFNTADAKWAAGEIEFGSDRVFISNASETDSRSLVSFVSPVRERADGDQMVLVMQADFNTIVADLSTQGSGVFTQVVDSQGRVVAGTQTSAIAGTDRTFDDYIGDNDGVNATIVKEGLGGKSGFEQNPGINSSLVAAYAPVGDGGGGLVVITHVPKSVAFSLRSTVTNSLLVLFGTVLLGFAFVALVFGRGTVQALGRLTEKAKRLENEDFDVDLTVRRADEFGTLTRSFASMRDSLRERITEAEEARKEAEEARAQAVEMSSYLQEKAETYSQIMQRCGSGDLTQRMETDGRNEAMDRIAEEFNNMIAELEKTTGQLQTFSDEVIETSEIVLTSAESVREASEQVASSAQRISDDAHNQRERLRNIANVLDEVIATFEEVAETNPDVEIEEQLDEFRDLRDEIEAAVDTSDGLLPETESVAGAAEEQAAELNEVSSRADKLKRYAQPLGEIVNDFKAEEQHEFVFSGASDSPVDE